MSLYGGLRYVGAPLALLLFAGCTKSSSPSVEDLVKISPPTFNQSLSSSISAPTISYTIHGECDVKAYLTQYSLDQATWTDISCTNGSFAIPIVVNGQINVWARSKGKFSYTATSHAIVRFVAPPTSDTVFAVASSRSDSSDSVGRGTQNVLGHGLEGETATGGAKKVFTQGPRIVYDQ